jgi:cephalosporin hydroxylase
MFESDHKTNLSKPLVSVGSYFVVFDAVTEDLDGVKFVERPWGKEKMRRLSG